ncbi:hypothetical protein ENSA5_31480 [Enhygromyxa salina]|uniref:Uncharacterized protein n=1 Tax=Enhygromyxa salina TaxID=215803 RepID=A0A2S9XXR0_9BACT|nr:hypothetical protein [Enhygromyxa salina]PRP97642.1 hypothetical protein ENSA5_31480 [Enhygromyxa salina]
MNKYLLPLCAALLLLPTAAAAAPSPSSSAAGPATTDEGAKVADGPTREYIFEDDSIEGEVLKPGGVHVGGRIAKDHQNMIGVRGEFIPQLIMLSFDI